MKPAAERLAEALESVSINVPVLPVLHNADVAAYSEAAQIRDALVRQLYSPVRWTETIRKLSCRWRAAARRMRAGQGAGRAEQAHRKHAEHQRD